MFVYLRAHHEYVRECENVTVKFLFTRSLLTETVTMESCGLRWKTSLIILGGYFVCIAILTVTSSNF